MVTDAGGGPASGGSSLAVLVRTWRERALLTQEQLARSTGLGVRTIRRLESTSLRRPRSESLRLLADVLKLTEAERAQLAAAARGGPAHNELLEGSPENFGTELTYDPEVQEEYGVPGVRDRQSQPLHRSGRRAASARRRRDRGQLPVAESARRGTS